MRDQRSTGWHTMRMRQSPLTLGVCPDAHQIGLMVVYSACVDYNSAALQNATGIATGTVGSSYSYYTDVSMMIFIGFGFLMTFLAKYAHSALGYTFLLSCLTIQLAILTNGFFHKLAEGHLEGDILIDVNSLIRALFAAGSVMISFGAVIGRTSPKQLIAMTILEVGIYSLNGWIGEGEIKAVDMVRTLHALGTSVYPFACACALNSVPHLSHIGRI